MEGKSCFYHPCLLFYVGISELLYFQAFNNWTRKRITDLEKYLLNINTFFFDINLWKWQKVKLRKKTAELHRRRWQTGWTFAIIVPKNISSLLMPPCLACRYDPSANLTSCDICGLDCARELQLQNDLAIAVSPRRYVIQRGSTSPCCDCHLEIPEY